MSAIEKTKSEKLPLPSERSFGIVMGIFFLLVGIYPLLKGEAYRLWSLGLSGVFFLLAWVYPKILRPLNWVWFQLGLLLNKLVSPIVMGIVFYLIVTPIGLLMRLSKKDLIGLKLDKNLSSYWKMRVPPGPSKDSFENQF